jgi:hypothetical protein
MHPNNISLEQLTKIARKSQELREREQATEKQEAEMEERNSELQHKIALFGATKKAVNCVLENDYQLEQVKMALQGYQLNVLTLSTELNKVRKRVSNRKKYVRRINPLRFELQKAERMAQERSEEVNELNEQLANYQFANNINLLPGINTDKKLTKEELKKATIEKDVPNFIDSTVMSNVEPVLDFFEEFQKGGKSAMGNENEQLEFQKARPSTEDTEPSRIETIIVDNSRKYEEQLRHMKESTLLGIQSYKVRDNL